MAGFDWSQYASQFLSPTSKGFDYRNFLGGIPGLGNPATTPTSTTPPTTTPGTTPTTPGTTTPTTAIDAILQNFQNALAAYITKPGEGQGGFGAGLADWLRQNQDYLQQRFLEEYMRRQMGQGNNLQAYTPQNYLAGFNPFTQYYMTPPQYRGNVGRMPAISTRALRV